MENSLNILIGQIKSHRQSAGLSLTDVSEKCGMPRPAISRIENGRNANPTFETLMRYADAVGLQINFSVSHKSAGKP